MTYYHPKKPSFSMFTTDDDEYKYKHPLFPIITKPGESRIKSGNSTAAPTQNARAHNNKGDKPLDVISGNHYAQTQRAGIAYPKDTTAELPAAADTVNAINEDIIQQTAGSHTGEINIPPLSDKGTNGVPTGEELSQAIPVAVNTTDESVADAPAPEYQPESGLAHAEDDSADTYVPDEAAELPQITQEPETTTGDVSNTGIQGTHNLPARSNTTPAEPEQPGKPLRHPLLVSSANMLGPYKSTLYSNPARLRYAQAFVPQPAYDFQRDYDFLKPQYKPGVVLTQDNDPLIAANMSESQLRYRTQTVNFLKTDQAQVMIALVRRASLGVNAAIYATDLVGLMERADTCLDESGLYTLEKGKRLSVVKSQMEVTIVSIWPLQQNGCLHPDNTVIVPVLLAGNSKLLPEDETSNIYGHLQVFGEPARLRQAAHFIPQMIKAHGVHDTYTFIEYSLPYTSLTKPEDREAPIVPLPVFGLLMRECGRLPRFRYLIAGLNALYKRLSRQTGILEVVGLLCLNALTLGDPGQMMLGMLDMAYRNRSHTVQSQGSVEDSALLVNHINSWLNTTFQEDFIAAAETFENGLYRRLFSQPPLKLYW